jgi:hypothetical protein
MDPLASWNDGPTKQALIDFVTRVTDEEGRDYVPPGERFAVFDNDGTLCCEKPLPVQADFHLRWLAEMTDKDPSELVPPYGDTTIDELAAAARSFVDRVQNPKLGRPYTKCVYQPMVELLRYLEAHRFQSYIVSGGGRDFMRMIAEGCYGVAPEHVIGSSSALKVDDDGPMKPVAIWSAIGRRPLLAGGNSNGDIPMLRFCAGPDHPWLALLIDHDDGDRDIAYDTGAEEALALAETSGWTVASVKNDWGTVFAR